MTDVARTAWLDRISNEPDLVVDVLVAMRILSLSPTETLLPARALRILLGLPPDPGFGVEEPEYAPRVTAR